MRSPACTIEIMLKALLSTAARRLRRHAEPGWESLGVPTAIRAGASPDVIPPQATYMPIYAWNNKNWIPIQSSQISLKVAALPLEDQGGGTIRRELLHQTAITKENITWSLIMWPSTELCTALPLKLVTDQPIQRYSWNRVLARCPIAPRIAQPARKRLKEKERLASAILLPIRDRKVRFTLAPQRTLGRSTTLLTPTHTPL